MDAEKALLIGSQRDEVGHEQFAGVIRAGLQKSPEYWHIHLVSFLEAGLNGDFPSLIYAWAGWKKFMAVVVETIMPVRVSAVGITLPAL